MSTILGLRNHAGTFVFQRRYEPLGAEQSAPVTLRLQSSGTTNEAAGADVASVLQSMQIAWLRPLLEPDRQWVVDRSALASYLGLESLDWLQGEQLVRPIFDRVESSKGRSIEVGFVLSPQGPLAWNYASQPEADGWSLVDRLVAKGRSKLESATASEDFQAIGLLCRDAIIILAQTVSPPESKRSAGDQPKRDDAKALLTGYFANKLGGRSNERHRRHAGSTLDLALHLQHKRSAGFKDGALCVEATTGLVNIVAIIEGRRS